MIAYASRALKPFEKNYSAYLLELSAAVWAIDYWHVYLTGRKFTLYTDHQPLTHLSSIHKRTLNRLQLQLLEHDMSIQYKAGEDNVVADALSRNAIEAVTVSNNAIEVLNDESGSLKEAQEKDAFCRDVVQYLKNSVLPAGPDGYVKKILRVAPKCSITIDGILTFYHERDNMRPVNAVVLPERLHHMVVEAAHNSWHGGHGGEDRTKSRVFLRYYWPGVHSYVANYVKACPNCQMAKGKKPPPSPLQSLPICLGRNERVHIDLFGPMKTKSASGNIYVMVITDAFSKWTELVAIPDKTAETVAQAFMHRWVCKFSVPLLIVTDNGREFANQVLTDLCGLLGITHNKTSAYHPQSNSSAESFNRSMKKYLRAMLDNSQTLEWEAQLPALQLSYNCHVHRSTLESPFWLTYLMDPRLPYFSLEETRPIYKDDFVTAAFEDFSQSHKLVHKNQDDARKVREQFYNIKAKERQFDVGDRVMFFHNAIPAKGVNAKFYKNWQGPYYVVKKISPLNYIIQKNPNSKTKLVNVEKLKHLKDEDFKAHFDAKQRRARAREAEQDRAASQLPPEIDGRDSDAEDSAESYQEIREARYKDSYNEGENLEDLTGARFAEDIANTMAEPAEYDRCDVEEEASKNKCNADFVRLTRSRAKKENATLLRGI